MNADGRVTSVAQLVSFVFCFGVLTPRIGVRLILDKPTLSVHLYFVSRLEPAKSGFPSFTECFL